MSYFSSKYPYSNKEIIDDKITLLQQQMKNLKNLIKTNRDDDYSREYTVIFNAFGSLENIRLYKLIHTN